MLAFRADRNENFLTKIIYILRHAKAHIADGSVDDHARALTGKGRLAAQAMGEWLKSRRIKIGRALCSSSVRTRETLELLQDGLEQTLAAEYTPKLYLCSPAEILNLLKALPDDVQSVLLIGHNPGMQQFCLDMAAHGDEALIEELALHFPTCALAEISVPDGAWSRLAFGQGTLRSFLPRVALREEELRS